VSDTPVSIEREGGIAVVTLDSPPVNAIGHAMRAALYAVAGSLDDEDGVRGVVLIARGRSFIAGADIGEFERPPEAPHLPDVIERIERARAPWVAAIHGTALGGGLEVALGCAWRIAARSARLGFPEVTLGLVPGAGGTVRLPRLVAPEAAVRLVTSGKPVNASEALELGLIDAVAGENLRADAIRFARNKVDQPRPEALARRSPVGSPGENFWRTQHAAIAKRARGQDSPLRALECVRRAVENAAEDALAQERETFLELRASNQAKALRHVFFAERAATKPPELADVEPRAVGSVGVVGGGTMGAGIAVALGNAGLPVVLIERDDESLERGRANVTRILDGAVKRGRLDGAARDARLASVRFESDYAALGDSDLVIEAVFEELETKRAVFEQLDAICRADTVFATNTSYLDPNAIAAASLRTERILGLHFFSPANVMKLLEIVPTAASAPEVVASGFALARKIGKIPVLAGVCDGFIGNRILKVTRAQAERLLLAGAMPADVDRAMRAFGMPMGPFEAQDLGGLDIAALQREAARERGDTSFAPIAERLVALGRLGQKSGGGWYDYVKDERTPRSSKTVASIIAEEAEATTLRCPSLSDETLAAHIVFPMIDEGARILEEGVARRASDIDLVEIHGYGFPRWRGGLMHYARTRGLVEIVEALDKWATHGLCEAPGRFLIDAAKRGEFPT